MIEVTDDEVKMRLVPKGGRREKKEKAEAAPEAPAAAPAFEAPPAEAPMNPFADSLGADPFPAANPLEAGYEKMEEVSLEQLLMDGRERPATISGAM